MTSVDARKDGTAAAPGRPVLSVPGVRQIVLLAGAVRPTTLMRAIGRSVLDLPLHDGRTVGQRWLDDVAEFAVAAGSADDGGGPSGRPPVRILIDRDSPPPRSTAAGGVDVRADDVEFLGTGGVLQRAAQGCTGRMLIATGGSVLLRSLASIAHELDRANAEVALLAERDGGPTGIMLVECRVLAELRLVGYADFKEQCLPMIAERHAVRVVHSRERAALNIRDTERYLRCLRHLAGDGFAVVEEGASMDPTARLHEAVALRGSRVEARAIVARSVLGRGGVGRGIMTDQTAWSES
ncbi:MAG: hypothetical protein AAFX79_07405 [Planctomycetota bacterium]